MKDIVTSLFGTTKSGEKVFKYTMENDNGMRVSVISYAASIQSVIVYDKKQNPVDVVLGYDTIEDYENGNVYLGAFVGRYANRISGAEFELNGEKYSLPKNCGNNHIHGSFAHREFYPDLDNNKLIFHGVSLDGEEGFPGTLTFDVIYSLSEQNELAISYKATTDKDTVINLTNHSYFNLNGQDGSTVLDHNLTLKAEYFTECDAETVPTGRILPVEATPMDFRVGKKIGRDICSDYDQIVCCKGYDHNFVLDGNADKEFAELTGDKTGIKMRCYTDQPGVQIYTGNYLKNIVGKGEIIYPDNGAICFETQHYPDSPNHPEFPTTVLKVGEMFESITIYEFATE